MEKRILIVDDEDRIRDLIKDALAFEDEVYSIYEAADGDEALKKAKEVVPHVMILDVMMPGKSGYEVCKEIKGMPEMKDVHVMILTARGSAISERTGELSGADEFIAKPFHPDDLVEKIKKAFDMA